MVTKSIKKISILPVLISLLISCEIATDWKFNPNESDYIIVNGIITNEKKEHSIVINRPIHELDETTEPVLGASVSISDGDSLYLLLEDPIHLGIYKTDSNFRAYINKTYTLFITENQQNYQASTLTLPVRPFNRLKYIFDGNKKMYTIDSVTQAFDESGSAMYEIFIDWTHVLGYQETPIEKKKAILYYYSLSTIDISEVFASEKERIYFPAGTTIIEKKYSLSPKHADFIRSMLLETEWRGSLFDVAQGNIETNMSEGAVGFFGSCSVLKTEFIVN